MAKLGTLTLPIFTEYNGQRFDIGEVEVPINVSLDVKPSGPIMRGSIASVGTKA